MIWWCSGGTTTSTPFSLTIADAAQHVLLAREPQSVTKRARGGRREPVDEPVEPRGAERAERALLQEDLPASTPRHVRRLQSSQA